MAKVKRVDDAVAAAWDKYVRENGRAKKAYGYSKKAKEAKQTVVEAMGEATRVRLPDGRILQRVTKSRTMPAQPKRDQEWQDVFEAEE